MATPIARNVGRRGTTMAIACGTVMAGALGSMFFMGQDVKGKEGAASPYSNHGQGMSGTDKTMNSSDVSAAISVPRPNKERLPTASQPATQGRH